MMDYNTWLDEISTEWAQLRAVHAYLSDEGKEREYALATLLDLGAFCGSAKELAEWVHSDKEMDQIEADRIKRGHVNDQLLVLSNIAVREELDRMLAR